MQAGSLGGQDRDGLVQVVVAGGQADRVVAGQLAHPGTVEQPAQDQHGLPEAGQRPPSLPGATPETFGVQQSGEVKHRLVAYGQSGGIGDTHGRRGTPE